MPIPDLKDCDAAEGYESPTYDSLGPQHQQFVVSWLRTMDYEQAALDAGYVKKTARQQGFRLARDPKIVTAIEELCDRRLASVEKSRASIVNRLMLEATVSKADLVEILPDGTERIKQYSDVEPVWRSCLGMVSISREGDVRFDTGFQNNSRKVLATYMKWDREPVEMSGGTTFNFHGIDANLDDLEPPPVASQQETLKDEHFEKKSTRSKNGRKTNKERMST